MGSLGNLTVVAAPFLAGLALTVVLAWCWCGLRWRGGPLARLRTGTAAGVLTLVLVADGFNSYYSYLPNVSDVVDAMTMNAPAHLNPNQSGTVTAAPPRRGRTARLRIPDRGSGFGASDAWIWLPPAYYSEPARRFPVVYLFHGSPGQPKDWFHGGDAARIAERESVPVIVVAPKLSRNWLDDPECVDGLHEKVESHLLHDVIPTVDAELRTEPNRTGRIFAGMSAGGFCALNLGLRNRSVTATVLDLSGETMPTHAGGTRALFGSNQVQVRQNSPALYAPPCGAGRRCGSGSTVALTIVAYWISCAGSRRSCTGRG